MVGFFCFFFKDIQYCKNTTCVSVVVTAWSSSVQELRERVLRGKYRIPFYMSTDCENLLKRFLVLNPAKRGTLEVREDAENVNIPLNFFLRHPAQQINTIGECHLSSLLPTTPSPSSRFLHHPPIHTPSSVSWFLSVLGTHSPPNF